MLWAQLARNLARCMGYHGLGIYWKLWVLQARPWPVGTRSEFQGDTG
jgi:hypothetical protein